MLSDRLTRGVARVILVTYITHLFAPVVHACEIETLTVRPWGQDLRNPSPPREASLQRPLQDSLGFKPHIETLKSSQKTTELPIDEERARSEAEAYQYRLRIKTLNSKAERFQLKLSRKEKGSNTSFERLHTAMVHKSRVSSTSSTARESEDDALLSLFKYASFENFSECFVWNLSGFKIVVRRDGSVLLDQSSTPLLSIYDLVLKTSGELLLQSLGVAELTLQSPKTQIKGTLVTNHLHMDCSVVNEGWLQVHKVSGQGVLTNHADFNLDGTIENPAILGVRQVINKKEGPKEVKIEGSHVHITLGNHSFLNGEGAEFRVREHLTVDDSPRTKASFTNMGSTYLKKNAVFDRSASNAGFWQAHNMTMNEKPFTNKNFGMLNILDRLTVNSELINDGDITAKNFLKVEKGVNKGTVKGDNLMIDIESTFLNKGVMTAQGVMGGGTFSNQGKLQFIGTPQAPAKIGIKHFENGSQDALSSKDTQSTPAKIKGSNIVITSTNQKFITHKNSEIVMTDSLIFKEPETPSSTSLELKGNIHADILDIYRQETINAGKVSAATFSVHGGRCRNAAGALLHAKKADKPQVVIADVATFQNDGEMVVHHGTFIQKTGEFLNTGIWNHTGNIDLGSTVLRNNGTMQWQKGTWTFSPQEYINNGTWVLDQMECSQPLTIHNYVTLHLQNSKLAFSHLINHKNLILSGGQYTVKDGLQSKGLMRFLEHDWTFTDDSTNTAPHRLVLDGEYAKKSHPTGEIESAKTLTYDLQALPGSIRSEGGVMFSKRHAQGRTLADLEKVSANGKVSFYTKDITTTKNYEFGNIGHLDLYVDGFFTTHHSLKAPVITLDVEGPLVVGKDNDVMGTIAATGYDIVFKTELPEDGKPLPRKIYIEQQGDRLNYIVMTPDGRVIEETIDLAIDRILKKDNETDDLKTFRTPILKKISKRGHIIPAYGSLTVTAHSVDGRFAKFYGAGRTHIKSTEGGILVGAFASSKASTVHVTDYPFHIQNGAYVSSGSTLHIESPTSIYLDYGNLHSDSHFYLKAKDLVRNKAGRISLGGNLTIETPEYQHTRAGLTRQLFDCDRGLPPTFDLQDPYPPYPGVPKGDCPTRNICYWDDFTERYPYTARDRDCPLSGPAVIEGFGDIIFNVYNVKNVASDFLCGGKIFLHEDILRDGAIFNKLPQYTEEPYYLNCRNLPGVWEYNFRKVWSIPCRILSAESIQINTGNAIISGNMNSRFIKVTTTGDLDIYGSNRTRRHVGPSLVNQTKAIANQVTPNNGFIQPNARHELETEFPIGTPYQPKGKPVWLVRPDNEHLYKMPMNLGQVINRLRNLSSGHIGLSVQSTLSEWAGRVYIEGSKGNNLKALEAHADKFYEETGKSEVTPEELLEKASRSMVLWSLEQEENRIYRDMILYIAPKDINPSQGISGEKGIFHAGKNLTLHGAALEFEDDVSVTADEKLRLLTILKRIYTSNGHYDVIDAETKVTSEKGKVTAIGETGFEMKGATLRSFLGLIAGSTRGNSDIEDVLLSHLERHTHVEDGGFLGEDKTTYTETETTRSHASKLQSQSDNVMVVSGEKNGKTRITGSHLKAFLALIFKGNELETNASVSKHRSITNTEIESAFSSSSSTSMQESATLNPTTLEGSVIYGDTEKATYRGTDFLADIFYDNSKEGAALKPTIAMLEYFQQTVSESAFAKSDVGCKGGYEVMHPCRLMVNKIVRDIDKGEIKLDSVLWDKNKTEIIGKFAETTYQLKQWHTEWAYHEQLIPDEALVVVALGIAIATQGVGIKALAPMLEGITAATGMQLSAAGIAMVNAGFTTLCSSAATTFLATGDPIQVGKGLVSEDGLKSLAISMASAGLCSQLGQAFNINMEAGQKVFMEHFKEQLLRGAVDTALNVAIADVPIDEALGKALKQIPVKTVAAYVANKIGALYGDKKIGYTEHKVDHILLGAVEGFALDPTLKGALSGAGGAFTAEVIGEALISESHAVALEVGEKLREEGKLPTEKNITKATKEVLHRKADIAKLVAGSVAVLTGQDASIAISTATNAVENNLVVAALPFILPEVYAILSATALGVANIFAYQQNQKALETLDAHLKERQDKQEGGAAQQAAHNSSGASGGMPNPDWEPEDEYECYKKELRKDMQRPHVEDSRLAEALQRLHRADRGVGNGSTAAAVRYEKATGQTVQGRGHIQKAEDGIKFLERWLEKNPIARPGDRAAAENVLRDLKDALGKK